MIVRIYTGHDGQTHFEDLPLPAEESHNVALQAGANLVFRCFPADYWSDWHTAPRRQYIFILVGQMEIGIGDGTSAVLDRVMLSSLTTSRAGATRRARWAFRGSVPLCRWAPNAVLTPPPGILASPDGAGRLPGTTAHPATPGRLGHTRGDCVCQSVNV
jgi:hypothetical protein